jgi:hypothetical protein
LFPIEYFPKQLMANHANCQLSTANSLLSNCSRLKYLKNNSPRRQPPPTINQQPPTALNLRTYHHQPSTALNSHLTIFPICGIILPTSFIKAMMETSRPAATQVWQRTRAGCEPGQTNGPKILPEPQAEPAACPGGSSKCAGLVYRYQDACMGHCRLFSRQATRTRLRRPLRREPGWYREPGFFPLVPEIGTGVLINQQNDARKPDSLVIIRRRKYGF